MNQLLQPTWFNEFKHDGFSQHGEDGIIEEIFNQIGATNKYVVECGALNGLHDSNAGTLILKKGWSALMIEADATAFEKLQGNYNNNSLVACANRFVSFEGEDTFDKIFKEYKLPIDFDLFVLDIDGNEYHVWNAMNVYRPRVMVVEFNQTIPNSVSFIQPKDMKVQQGSSLLALKNLGKEKKYRLVAVTDINAFFVRDEDAEPFDDLANDLDVLRSNNPYETKLFQLYDGTLKIEGNPNLIWHNKPIDEKKMQVLSSRERFFPNGISGDDWVRKVKYYGRKIPLLYPVILRLRKITFFRRILK